MQICAMKNRASRGMTVFDYHNNLSVTIVVLIKNPLDKYEIGIQLVSEPQVTF